MRRAAVAQPTTDPTESDPLTGHPAPSAPAPDALDDQALARHAGRMGIRLRRQPEGRAEDLGALQRMLADYGAAAVDAAARSLPTGDRWTDRVAEALETAARPEPAPAAVPPDLAAALDYLDRQGAGSVADALGLPVGTPDAELRAMLTANPAACAALTGEARP